MNDPAASGKVKSPETDSESTAPGPRKWLRSILRFGNGDSSPRDTLEELLEEREESEVPITAEERALLANILELRSRDVHDVMVPRVDIIAIDEDTELSDIIDLITQEGHSRLPVFKETLDDAIGFIHAKDVLAWRGKEADFAPDKIIRNVLFVAPSMQVLELLLEMRVSRSHMALVVDEFGGVDGLVTIEDLVEEIVGEIEDEHDRSEGPRLIKTSDGSYIADARVTTEALELEFGEILSEEEREDLDTLGGLVFALAGRVPIRGELIRHPSGFEFEVLDADPRRIRRLRMQRTGKKQPKISAQG